MNIELLRIILMILIVFHHLLVHGLNFKSINAEGFHSNSHTISDGLVESFLVMAVYCFVFISGYYGLKFRIKTVLNLIIQTFTYSVLIYILYDLIVYNKIILLDTVKGFLPISRAKWWFITTYFFLYLLSPLLNLAKKYLTKFQFIYVVLVITSINFAIGFVFDPKYLGVFNGYSLIGFISVYLWGQAFSEYFKIKRGRLFYLSIYIISCLGIFLMFYISLKYINHLIAWKMFSYNNPLVMISAISFFFLFKSFKIYNTKILYFSSAALGVYLIHDHFVSRKFIIDNLSKFTATYNLGNVYLTLLLIAIMIFILGALVERIRMWVSDPLINYTMKRFNLIEVDKKLNI